jgi:flagellar hook-associated protein 2
VGISSPGIGSNLDINGIVAKLMQAEARPLSALARKEAGYQAKLSAFGGLSSALGTLQGALGNLSKPTTFQSMSATSSETTVLTASASAKASAGSYSIDVTRLAQAQTLTSAGVASTTATIGNGTDAKLTFQFGTITGGKLVDGKYVSDAASTPPDPAFTQDPNQASGEVTINTANNSLQGIRDSINKANLGVTASIVSDGSATPHRMVIRSNKTGEMSSVKISVQGNEPALTSLLAHDPAATQNMNQTSAAQSAALTVNGIAVTSQTNSVSGAIEGVSLDLVKVGATNVTTTRNTGSATSAISAFVKAYNDLNTTIKNLSGYNAETKQAGPLIGDSSVRTIQMQVRKMIGSPLTGSSGNLSTLSQAGITIAKDGTMSLDSGKLSTAMSNDMKDVAALFSSIGASTDSLVGFTSSTAATKAGSYEVFVSKLASQGKLVGAQLLGTKGNLVGSVALGATTTIDGTNKDLTVSLDGVSTTLSLAQGSYTPAQLATEVQSAINRAPAFTSGGLSVGVTLDASNIMTITSNKFGSPSKVSVAGTGAATLLGTPTATNGTDSTAAITSTNKDLVVTVDDITATVSLVPRATAYTPAELAAQVQSAINGASAFSKEGIAVSVKVDANGVLSVTSNKYGSVSKVGISGNGATNLFGAAVATAGIDVEGTIGGVKAGGSGQSLTGAAGSDAVGMKLEITGGAANASRGTVTFSKGYGFQLDKLLEGFLGKEGTIGGRTDGINRSIKDVGKMTEAMNNRLADVEKRYRAQFTALDVAISRMSSTSAYLSQQLAQISNMSN